MEPYLNLKNIKFNLNPPVENFYGTVIKGACCIVGKNGSGKSNLIEYMIKNIYQIFKDNSILELKKEFKMIYYAPIINEREFNKSIENFINISEKVNIINFNKIDVDKPEELKIKLESLKINEIYTSLYILWLLTLNNNLDFFHKDVTRLKAQINHNLFVFDSNISEILSEFKISNLTLKTSANNNTENILLILIYKGTSIIKKEDFDNYKSDNVLDVLKLLDYFIENKSKYNSQDKFFVSNIEKLKIILEKYSWKIENITDYNDIHSFIELYIVCSNKKLYNIQCNFKSIIGQKSDFTFSSGDNAYLSFMSKVLLELRFQILKNIECNQYILFLDEVDIALHPQRQKSLFNILVQNIGSLKVLNKDLKVIIVLSTHSPFLTSDIPKDNIIYLIPTKDKKDNHYSNMLDGDDKPNAFANNIHSIYKNSFYLEDGLIGDFASNLILKKIIKSLNTQKNKSLTEKKKEEIEKYINLIGEPILRQKLIMDFGKLIYKDDKLRVENLLKKLEKEVGK